MRWRLLVMAVAGFSATLAACSFDDAFKTYCGYPGRCAKLNDAGTLTKIAQGTRGRNVTLTGVHLGDASVVTTVPDVGTVSGLTSLDGEISLVLNLNHGVPEGDRFWLRVVWDETRDELEDSDPFVVTAIHVADGGSDTDAGDGTDVRPYATLAFAGQKSGPGDTIRLGPGQFGTIFPSPSTPCDDGTFRLAPGVTVEGVPGGSTSIVGTGDPGTCAFSLSSTDQVVQHLTIARFATGILSIDAGYNGASRPRVTDVKIDSCDAGAVVTPGSSLLLQQVDIFDAGFGLMAVGADVRFEGGSVQNSFRAGVSQYGDGGALVLSQVDVRNNGATFTTSPTSGAGVLLAAIGASAFIDGGVIESNGYTSITVAGAGNAVTIRDSTLQGFQTYGLAVVGGANDASVTLSGATIKDVGTGIYVEHFGTFNGGVADAGGGNYIHDCASYQIWDARSAAGPQMTFGRTVIQSSSLSGGTIVDSSNGSTYGIQFSSGLNQIIFY